MLITESALSWDKEPDNPTEAVEGENVTLRWDYNLDGGTFYQVQWERVDGSVRFVGSRVLANNPVVFAAFQPRFQISESEEATLIISNVNRTDTGKYKCQFQIQEGQNLPSEIQLDVLCKYKLSSS